MLHFNPFQMNGGIDKIHLKTTDFSIKKVSSAIFGIDTSIRQGAINGDLPYLTTDQAGNQLFANKIYHNSEKGLGNYSINDKGLLIGFNPSKIMHPYRLSEIGSKPYNEAISMVKKYMQNELGIITDFEKMKLERIDVAKQMEMSQPCYQYDAAFRMMKGNRAKDRIYDGGYMFGQSREKQFIFYDKRKEMEYLKIDGILNGEKNFMRGEMRALKNKSVAGILNAGDLQQFNDLSAEYVNESYCKYMHKNIFSVLKESKQLSFDFDSEVEIMRAYKNLTFQGRGGWQKYLTNEGIDATLLKVGGLDMFAKICREAGYSRMHADRIKNELRQMLLQKAQIDNKRKIITPASLIAELQEKFAA